jgi:acyl carrier protein
MEIEEQVRGYILENFLYTDDPSELSDDQSLFDSGVVDSTGVLELVSFIEDSYGVQVDDTELIPDNFDSVEKISAYIKRKVAEADA